MVCSLLCTRLQQVLESTKGTAQLQCEHPAMRTQRQPPALSDKLWQPSALSYETFFCSDVWVQSRTRLNRWQPDFQEHIEMQTRAAPLRSSLANSGWTEVRHENLVDVTGWIDISQYQ